MIIKVNKTNKMIPFRKQRFVKCGWGAKSFSGKYGRCWSLPWFSWVCEKRKSSIQERNNSICEYSVSIAGE